MNLFEAIRHKFSPSSPVDLLALAAQARTHPEELRVRTFYNFTATFKQVLSEASWRYPPIAHKIKPLAESICNPPSLGKEDLQKAAEPALQSLWNIQLSPGTETLLGRWIKENPNSAQSIRDAYEQTMNQTIPLPPSEILNPLCFLGYEEAKFEKIENFLVLTLKNLIEEGINTGKIPKEEESYYLNRFQDYLQFARAAYELRVPNRRKTGEPYYYHALGTAWLYLTMRISEPGWFQRKKAIPSLLEDTGLALIHDVLEDIPLLSITREGSGFFLSLLASPGKDSSLILFPLSRREFLILAHLTKDPNQKATWIRQIAEAGDSEYPQFGEEEHIQRAVAGIKLADRLHNLLTMSYTGKSLIDILAKLEETIQTGWQIGWLAHFGNRGPRETLALLQYYDQAERLIPLIGILPILAQAEKLRLIAWAGKKFCLTLMEKIPEINQAISDYFFEEPPLGVRYPWIFEGMWRQFLRTSDALQTALAQVEQPASSSPIVDLAWQKTVFPRTHQKFETSKIFYVPFYSLPLLLGEENFVQKKIHIRSLPSPPLSFTEILEEATRVSSFLANYELIPGILPGGVDSVFCPKPDCQAKVLQMIVEEQSIPPIPPKPQPRAAVPKLSPN